MLTEQQIDSRIVTYSILSYILAALSFLGFLAAIITMLLGIFLSGDTGDELLAGVIGCLVLAVPAFAAGMCNLAAGIGLTRRRLFGYYCLIAGAVLAVLTCIGAVYTVFVLIDVTKPEFKAAFAAGPVAPRYLRH